jgi:hypothetical protein
MKSLKNSWVEERSLGIRIIMVDGVSIVFMAPVPVLNNSMSLEDPGQVK